MSSNNQNLTLSKQSEDVRVVGVIFLLIGFAALIYSILFTFSTFALIGLGLVFWGSLFITTKPVSFVKSQLMLMMVHPAYLTIERIITDLECKEKGLYIPSLAEKTTSQYLVGLSDIVVFIPSESSIKSPSLDDLAEKRFLNKKTKGVSVIPPGLDLYVEFKKGLQRELDDIEPTDLYLMISRFLKEELRLTQDLQMELEEDKLLVRVNNSIFRSLYIQETIRKSVNSVGCPLISMICCVLTENSRKIVGIDKILVSPNGELINTYLTFN